MQQLLYCLNELKSVIGVVTFFEKYFNNCEKVTFLCMLPTKCC